MTYLVKALAVARKPVRPGVDVDWAVGEIREVDDSLIVQYENNPQSFAVLAGPDLGQVVTAALQNAALPHAGSVAGDGSITVEEGGTGIVHQTTVHFNESPMTLRALEQGNSLQFYDWPDTNILFMGASARIEVTTTTDLAETLHAGVDCNWAVGFSAQEEPTLSGDQSTVVSVGLFVSSTAILEPSDAVEGIGVLAIQPQGGGTVPQAFLNIGVPNAEDISGDAIVFISGRVTMTWLASNGQP